MRFIALDHFELVAEHLLRPFDQRARVTAVNEHLGDGVEAAEQPRQHGPCSNPVLNTGGVYDHRQQVALRVDRDVPLSPLDLLTRVVTALPPFSAVLADCESMIATLGVVFRPLAVRPCSRSDLVTRSHVPSSRHARNC